jgi:hypothetical protein
MNEGLNFVLSTGAATTSTLYLVAMFKNSFPAARSRSVMLCALLSGVAVSFVVTVAQGTTFTLQNAALALLGGIGAAASAAGVRSVDNKADEKRGEVQAAAKTEQ